jgi:hypothetical protein
MRIALVLLLACTGCTTTVIPPARPIDPVTVYLTDYGRHTSLLLPAEPGRYTEYAFGDWDFFARGQTRWWVALRAMLHSPQATLGRRQMRYPGDDESFKRRLGCRRLMKFQASRQAVDVVLLNLERPFRISSTRPLHSDYSALDHVHDDQHYWGCHNCNHETARWLRQLGCRIDGPAILSNFVVEQPAWCGNEQPISRTRRRSAARYVDD